MKVLLIYPDEPKSRYSSYSKVGSYLPPLGLAYIAALLEKAGYEVKIIDNSIMLWSIEKIINEIRLFNPSCIGFSATSAMIPFTKRLAREIKDEFKNIFLIAGGPGVTADKNLIFETAIDFGVYGEGEYSFLELISTLEKNNQSFKGIKGIIINIENEKIINPPRPYIENLDNLPMPALHLLPDINLYRINPDRRIEFPLGTIISSRGCPYNCIFCDHNIFSRTWRGHSAKRVVDEMKRLVNIYGVREIDFEDDLFIFDKKRVIEICKLIKKEGLKIKWQCTVRANLVDEELIKEMASAGCWLVSIGVESGSQRILNLIKKGITIEQVKKAVTLAHKYKIKPRGYFMINHPSETREEIKASMNLALSLPFHTIIVCITTPYPNTELWKIAEKYGSFKKDISQMTEFPDDPNFITKGFTKKEILELQKNFYIKFFFRPKLIWGYFTWIFSLKPRQSLKLFKYYAEAGPVILKA